MSESATELAFRAELESSKDMLASLEGGMQQIRGFGASNVGTLKVACPEAAQEISMIASGRVPKEDRTFALVTAIAKDLGHDVEYVDRRERRKGAPLTKRQVEQELRLDTDVTWDDVITAMLAGVEYLSKKVELLSGVRSKT